MSQTFKITEKDYRTTVTNLAMAEARGQEITRLHSLLLSITGKEWDRTTPVGPGEGFVDRRTHDYVNAKNQELGMMLDEEREKLKNSEATLKLLDETNRDLKAKCEAVRFLDQVCEILNREHPKRPVTYDEVPQIVEVDIAHRDSARNRCGKLAGEVKDLQELLDECRESSEKMKQPVDSD